MSGSVICAMHNATQPEPSMLRTITAAVVTTALISACVSEAPAPGGGETGVAVSIAALNLTGIGDAVWDLRVRNGASTPETVVTRRLTASRYGDGAGSASYVAPCDADDNDNTVELRLVGIYAASVTTPGAWGDAAPAGTLPFQDPGLMSQTVTCVADQDVAVRFDVAVVRPAQQGFFDVAVSFADVFCAAKYDCAGAPLLFDAGGDRGPTHVLGFACTAGPSAERLTTLYLHDVEVDCGASGMATIHPDAGTGNLCVAGQTATCAGVDDPNGLLYQAAVYRGVEELTGFDKVYWNVALGLEDAAGCTVTTRATADDGTIAGDDGAITAGRVYPYVDWDVDLDGCPASFPLTFGSVTAVTTRYTETDDTADLPFANAFGPSLPSPPDAEDALVMYLDAGDAASWGGAGQLWKNLVSSPADGSPQAAYDFHLGGTGSSETKDPHFNGTVGAKSVNEYWSFDGGDLFTIAGGNTAFINAIHKDSARYTIILWVRTPPAFSSFGNFIGTGGWNAAAAGFNYSFRNGPRHAFSARIYGTVFMSAAGATPTTNTPYMMGISVDEPSGVGFLYLNGAYDQVAGNDTFDATYVNPTTVDAICALEIGNVGCQVGDNYLPNGTRVYAVRIFNRALTKAEMDAEWDLARARMGL